VSTRNKRTANVRPVRDGLIVGENF